MNIFNSRDESCLLLIKGLGLGGAERHVVDIAHCLKQQGVAVTVAFFLAHKTALVDELRSAGIEVIQLSRKPRLTLASLWAYLRLVKRKRFTLVHSHLPIPGLVARLGRLFFKYRLIHTEHNVLTRLHPLVSLLNRWTYGVNHEVIACSEPVWESMRYRGCYIDNGVDVVALQQSIANGPSLRRRFSFLSNEVVWVCVANLWPKKNHALLLDAFSKVVKLAPEARLVLVGQDASERPKLQAFVQQLGLEGIVVFNGPDVNAARLLGDVDGFVLASDFEGLPLSVLEAMVARLPVVCTAVGGLPKVVLDRKTGRVVPPRAAEALSAALVELTQKPEARRRLGQAGRVRVEANYSLEHMCESLFDIYFPQRGAS